MARSRTRKPRSRSRRKSGGGILGWLGLSSKPKKAVQATLGYSPAKRSIKPALRARLSRPTLRPGTAYHTTASNRAANARTFLIGVTPIRKVPKRRSLFEERENSVRKSADCGETSEKENVAQVPSLTSKPLRMLSEFKPLTLSLQRERFPEVHRRFALICGGRILNYSENYQEDSAPTDFYLRPVLCISRHQSKSDVEYLIKNKIDSPKLSMSF